MRILADLCVHKDVIEALRQSNIAIERCAEKGLSKSTDDEIYAYAQKHDYVLLTYDKDFGNIVRFDIRHSKGIVIIYVEGMTKDEIIQKSFHFFRQHNEKSLKGRLCLIEVDGERFWPQV